MKMLFIEYFMAQYYFSYLFLVVCAKIHLLIL